VWVSSMIVYRKSVGAGTVRVGTYPKEVAEINVIHVILLVAV